MTIRAYRIDHSPNTRFSRAVTSIMFEVYCLHRLPDASEAKLVAWLQELERKIDLERSYKGQDF